MAVSIPSLWSSSQRACLTLTSTGTWLLLSFESLLCSLVCFFSPRRLCSRSWSLRSCSLSVRCSFFLTGKSCSSLFTLLLKTALSLALVRFLVPSIHSGTFLFQESCKRDILLAKSSTHWDRSVRMRIACGSPWTLNQNRDRWRARGLIMHNSTKLKVVAVFLGTEGILLLFSQFNVLEKN